MKNFPVKVDGKEFWISRSIAVACFIYKIEGGNGYVLVNKRGKGTPDYQGYYNCICGYLDYGETLKEACAREAFEECGVTIDPNKLKFFGYNDDPSESKQNVTFRFGYMFNNQSDKFEPDKARGGEKDEVTSIEWIPVDDIDDYKFAFGHEKLIFPFYLRILDDRFQ